MKLRRLLSTAAMALLSAVRTMALTIPSDGSDGVFARGEAASAFQIAWLRLRQLACSTTPFPAKCAR